MPSNTVDVIVRLVDQISGRMGKVNSALAAVDKTGAKANTSMQALSAGLAGLTVAGIYVGLKRVADAFIDISKEGAQFLRVATAFKLTVTDMGESYVDSLGQMRDASRNTISDFGLMLQANKAFALGVATSSDQLGELIKVSTVLGRRTGLGQETSLERLFVGIGRLSPRILDDLGIAVNLTNLYSQSSNKAASELTQQEKIQMLLNHVIKTGTEQLALYKDGLDDTMSSYERVTAAVINFRNELGQSPASDWLADRMDTLSEYYRMQRLYRETESGTASVSGIGAGVDVLVKQLEAVKSGGTNDVWGYLYNKERIREIETSLNQLRVAQGKLIDTNPMGYSMTPAVKATPEVNYAKMAEVQGKMVLDVGEKIADARIRLNDAVSVAGKKAAQDEVDMWVAQGRRIITDYNSVMEEIDGKQIDMKPFLASGAVGEVPQMFNAIAEKERLAAEEAENLEIAQKHMMESFNKSSAEYEKAIGGVRTSLKEQSTAALVQDPSSGMLDVVAKARMNLEAATGAAAGWYAAGMSTVEVNARIAAAFGVSSDMIVDYQAKMEQAAQNNSMAKMGLSGEMLLGVIPQLNQAMLDFDTAVTSEAQVEAANRISALRDQVVALATEYNVAATATGQDLIDIEKVKQGEIGIADATGKLSIFNAEQLKVPSIAQAAGDAMRNEADAAGMLISAMGGLKTSIFNTLLGLTDVYSPQELAEFNAGFQARADVLIANAAAGEDVSEATFQLKADEQALMKPLLDNAEAMRGQKSAAESLAKSIEGKLKAAYDELNGVVSGELQSSLNVLSTVNVKPEDYGAYKDVPAENAKRLAAIMVEGIKEQPWLAEFRAEVPGIWEELVSSGDPQKAAATMLQQFQDGARPELIDFTALKQQIKDKIKTQLRIKDMATDLTNELITEMGAGSADEIKQLVGASLGQGIEDSALGGQTAIALLDQFNSKEFSASLISAGTGAAGTWGGAFVAAMPEHAAQVVEMLATLVTPAVQAKIAAQNATTKVK